jgi:CDP-diacylglycerol--serine O-phosphatidyltransferase
MARVEDRSGPKLSGHFSMIRSFHLADLFTLANGASGTAAVFLAMESLREESPARLLVAAALVTAAIVFDVLDGRIARWRHVASPMGRELDSLADVISFGVAPACLAYAIGLSTLVDQLVLLYFVACGISRLARYNVTAESMSEEAGKVTYFEGTPIPTSLLLVFAIAGLVWAGRTGDALPLGRVLAGALAFHPAVLAFFLSGSLMISKTLRIPKP